jgi:integrase
MGRPRLEPGTHGNIRVFASRGKWEACTRYCDLDGVTRPVRRFADSKQAANAALQKALRNRPGASVAGELSAATPFEEVAAAWMVEIDNAVADGHKAPNTARVYRTVLRKHLLPVFGPDPVSTVKTKRLADFLRTMREHHQADLVKTTRTVLNGVLGFAARNELIDTTPMRDVGRIRGKDPKKVRPLTDLERRQWLAKLSEDPRAVRDDLPDLTLFMLGCGCRISEALAVHWDSVNFDDKTVAIDWSITRLENGAGLVRGPTKTTAGARTLFIPGWCVDMLRDRHDRQGGRDGPVFPPTRRSIHRWRDPSNTSRSFRLATEQAGFGWITSHVFRRTVGSQLHEAGLTDREVADHLGHGSTRTLQHYIGRRATGESAAAALELGWDVSGVSDA